MCMRKRVLSTLTPERTSERANSTFLRRGPQPATVLSTSIMKELTHAAKELFEQFFELAATGINLAGGMSLVFTAVGAIAAAIQLKLLGSTTTSMDEIRLDLMSGITFALELLVAADVIETLTKSAHSYHIETLYKIIAIVAIRTTLAYFLGKEMSELEEKITKEAKASGKKAKET